MKDVWGVVTETNHRECPSHPVGGSVRRLHDVPTHPCQRILNSSIYRVCYRGDQRTDPLGAELGGQTDVAPAPGELSTLPCWSHLRDEFHISQCLPNLFIIVQPFPVTGSEQGEYWCGCVTPTCSIWTLLQCPDIVWQICCIQLWGNSTSSLSRLLHHECQG